MRKLRYTIITESYNQGVIPSYEGIMTAVMSRVENLVCQYKYLLPNGWRTIIHISAPKGVCACLDLQSNAGGGTYAQAKMNTLTCFPKRYASGGETIDELVKMIGLLKTADWLEPLLEAEEQKELERLDDLMNKVSTFAATAEIPDSLADYMNEQYLIAPYYGAIKIPYETLSGKLNSPNQPEHGEIRISFSGASQEQDVMFATWIFRELQRRMVANLRTEQLWFNLRHLENIPNVQLWIDLLDVRESLCP